MGFTKRCVDDEIAIVGNHRASLCFGHPKLSIRCTHGVQSLEHRCISHRSHLDRDTLGPLHMLGQHSPIALVWNGITDVPSSDDFFLKSATMMKVFAASARTFS